MTKIIIEDYLKNWAKLEKVCNQLKNLTDTNYEKYIKSLDRVIDPNKISKELKDLEDRNILVNFYLEKIEYKLNIIETMISILDEDERKIIEGFYKEKNKVDYLCHKLNCSRTSYFKIKNSAINKMIGFITNVELKKVV